MKALVPSGGRGVRLRPLTYTNAKQLVPVGGEPVLFRVLRHIAEAGVRECGIVVGDTAAEIESAVGDGSAFGLAITYIPQDDPLGLADCVRISQDFLGDDPFVMYLGDNMLADGVAGIVAEFETDPVAAQILAVRVPHPERFGVVTLAQDGTVAEVEEKPPHPKSDLALAGVYVFSREVHDAIAVLEPSARGELEITDAIQLLIEKGSRVRVHEAVGWWKDTGLPGDLLEANRLVLDGLSASRIEGEVDGCEISGEVIVEAGAVIEGGRLIGPCFVGAGAVLRHATVGPCAAIGAGCTVEDATIENSILMDGCVVHRSTLKSSVLGRGVEVRGPGSAQVIVGDHGILELG